MRPVADGDAADAHAARAELLIRAGRSDEAVDAFTAAIALTTNDSERRHLTRRRDTARAT